MIATSKGLLVPDMSLLHKPQTKIHRVGRGTLLKSYPPSAYLPAEATVEKMRRASVVRCAAAASYPTRLLPPPLLML